MREIIRERETIKPRIHSESDKKSGREPALCEGGERESE